MSAQPPKRPHLSSATREARDARRARLAEALRENLKKRKAQARGRAQADRPGRRDEESR